VGFEFLVPWHAFLPRDDGHVVVWFGHEDAPRLRDAAAAAIAAEGVACRCCGLGDGGLDAAAVDDLAGEQPGSVVLAAAASADPVLPARTSLVMPVVPLTGFAERGWDELTDVVCGPVGLLSRAAPGTPAAPALLRLDDCLDSIGLFAALGRLMAERDVPLLVLGEVRGPQPRLRAVYRVEGPSPAAGA
jgi:hypothetical protein